MNVEGARRPDHACVVGGGIAGLTAALRLAQAGVGVTVVEASRPGGRIRTTPFAGRPVEEGPDAFLARVPAAVALAEERGLGAGLEVPARRSAYVVADGRLEHLPTEQVLGVPTNLYALAATGLCTPAGVAAARPDAAGTLGPLVGPDVTVGAVLRARLGDEITDRLVAPLVGGINAGDIDKLSLAAVTPVLDAAARRGPGLVSALAAQRAAAAAERRPGDPDPPVFLAPRQGMERLVEALVARLHSLDVEVLVGEPATALQRTGGTWQIAAGRTTVTAESLVLATPAPISARLLRDVAPPAAELLAGIEYASVTLVTYAFDPAAIRRPLDASGYLVPRTEGLLLTAATWLSEKWAHLAPAAGNGTALVRASAGRAGDERAWRLTDEELIAHLASDLATTMGAIGEPLAARVHRHEEAFPQYAPGHLDLVARVEAELADVTPDVVLAGAALRGVGIPACIASGQTAAEALLTPTAG